MPDVARRVHPLVPLSRCAILAQNASLLSVNGYVRLFLPLVHHGNRDSETSGDSIFAPIVLGNGRPVISQKIPTLVITRWWMRPAHCTVNDQPDECPAPVIINTYAFGQSAGESTLLLSGSRGTRLGQIRSVES